MNEREQRLLAAARNRLPDQSIIDLLLEWEPDAFSCFGADCANGFKRTLELYRAVQAYDKPKQPYQYQCPTCGVSTAEPEEHLCEGL
jgi:hypothetical protein